MQYNLLSVSLLLVEAVAIVIIFVPDWSGKP